MKRLIGYTIMASDIFRSPEVIVRYKARRKELRGDTSEVDMRKFPFVAKWMFWTLVENEFPYDLISSRHCMLVPIRRFSDDDDMNEDERNELFSIKKEFAESKEFDAVMENIKHNRTIPAVYHLHCLKLEFRTPVSDFS